MVFWVVASASVWVFTIKYCIQKSIVYNNINSNEYVVLHFCMSGYTVVWVYKKYDFCNSQIYFTLWINNKTSPNRPKAINLFQLCLTKQEASGFLHGSYVKAQSFAKYWFCVPAINSVLILMDIPISFCANSSVLTLSHATWKLIG